MGVAGKERFGGFGGGVREKADGMKTDGELLGGMAGTVTSFAVESSERAVGMMRAQRKVLRATQILQANRSLGRFWSFAKGDELVCGDVLERVSRTERPAHFDVRGLFGAQAEMQAWVIRGDVAGLAHHFLHLRLAAVTDYHATTDSAAIAPRSLQADLQPMI